LPELKSLSRKGYGGRVGKVPLFAGSKDPGERSEVREIRDLRIRGSPARA